MWLTVLIITIGPGSVRAEACFTLDCTFCPCLVWPKAPARETAAPPPTTPGKGKTLLIISRTFPHGFLLSSLQMGKPGIQNLESVVCGSCSVLLCQ